MGKGDKKSRRGKVTNGSYGKTRMRKPSEPLFDKVESTTVETKVEKKPAEKKKAPAKKAAEPKAEKPEKPKKVEKTKVADEEAD